MSAAPEPVTAVFAREVRRLRTERGWSRNRAAGIAGVSASGWWRAEHGDNVSLELAGRLAGALGMPLAALVAPDSCGHCYGAPGPGFDCRLCGTAGPEVTGERAPGGQPGNGTGESR